MAPKGTSKGSNGAAGGRIKFRFVDIEMENVNESVTEGLKSLAAALSRAPQVVVTRALPRTSQASRSAVTEEIADLDGELSAEPEVLEDDDVAGDDEPSSDSEETQARKPRKFRAPKFRSDIDLTSASKSLEDFIQEKTPSSLADKYLVIAQWFNEFMSIPEVTVDHIFTAFESLGWRSQMPQDAGSPLRGLKNANLVDSGAGRGAYKINWSGTKTVAGMGETK